MTEPDVRVALVEHVGHAIMTNGVLGPILEIQQTVVRPWSVGIGSPVEYVTSSYDDKDAFDTYRVQKGTVASISVENKKFTVVTEDGGFDSTVWFHQVRIDKSAVKTFAIGSKAVLLAQHLRSNPFGAKDPGDWLRERRSEPGTLVTITHHVVDGIVRIKEKNEVANSNKDGLCYHDWLREPTEEELGFKQFPVGAFVVLDEMPDRLSIANQFVEKFIQESVGQVGKVHSVGLEDLEVHYGSGKWTLTVHLRPSWLRPALQSEIDAREQNYAIKTLTDAIRDADAAKVPQNKAKSLVDKLYGDVTKTSVSTPAPFKPSTTTPAPIKPLTKKRPGTPLHKNDAVPVYDDGDDLNDDD